MHLSCIICSDILTPSAEIHTTHCGHLFHYVCLIKWIERFGIIFQNNDDYFYSFTVHFRSCTCPQCRCKISEKTIHRVYFNLANADGIQDDAVTLQYKMDNMDFQIKLKDKDIQICKDKNKKLKEQNIALRYHLKL